MSQAAVFQGTFSDIRTVKGRKIVQLIIEVPQELGNSALQALGGLPDPANPVWVAVARIDPKAAEEPKSLPAPEKERKKWEEMPPSQQAAIRCDEEPFRRFLDENVCTIHGWDAPSNADEAAQVVRHFCLVASRADINTTAAARRLWEQLENDYWAWQRGMH